MSGTCEHGVLCMKSQDSSNTHADLENRLTDLVRCSVRELRIRWKELFRSDPPVAFGPDLLRRVIAHKIQESAYGGLNDEVRIELSRLIKQLEMSPTGTVNLPRRIKPGSVLVREWKGKSHRVTISENGFIYKGKSYRALSEIALLITGTRWNGPRFFGLRKPNKESEDKSPKSRRGRKAAPI